MVWSTTVPGPGFWIPRDCRLKILVLMRFCTTTNPNCGLYLAKKIIWKVIVQQTGNKGATTLIIKSSFVTQSITLFHNVDCRNWLTVSSVVAPESKSNHRWTKESNIKIKIFSKTQHFSFHAHQICLLISRNTW